MAKTFIITGASKGIGAAVARYLLETHHNVVLTARSAGALEEMRTRWPDRVAYIAQDVASPDAATRLADLAVQKFGRIDGLVVNHGLLEQKRLADDTLDSIRNVFDVNLFSSIAMAKACLQQLRQTKGCIVWLSSGAAAKAYVAWGSYCASKAAVNQLSHVLSAEEPDITTVAVAPGRVDTDMQALVREAGGQAMDKAQHDGFVKAHRDGALLRPEMPGHVVAKLVCDPRHELSGKFLSWNSPELAAYQ